MLSARLISGILHKLSVPASSLSSCVSTISRGTAASPTAPPQTFHLPWPLCLWNASSSQCVRGFATNGDDFYVGLDNLRDNPGATKSRIRVGRGDGGKRGNYCGRGMKGQKARGRKPHMLYDGGQLSLIKYPITRERPSYEVLYHQVGLSKILEFIQLGLLDPKEVITMKDLMESGCAESNTKYGVRVYGKVRLNFPLHLQVTACDEAARMSVQSAGGKLTRVYYTTEGIDALLHPVKFTAKCLPLPLPAVAWHPRYNNSFDALGQIPPNKDVAAPLLLPRSWTEILSQAAIESAAQPVQTAMRFTIKKPQSSPTRGQMGVRQGPNI